MTNWKGLLLCMEIFIALAGVGAMLSFVGGISGRNGGPLLMVFLALLVAIAVAFGLRWLILRVRARSAEA